MKKALRRLDAVHEKLLATVSQLSPEIYSARPAEDQWSVAEIVHRLALVEDRVIKELEAALEREPQSVGFLRRLLPTSIVSSRVVRVKAPKALTPLEAPTKNAGLENLGRTRTSLKNLCDTHGHERFRNLIFKHPFLGKIDGVATVSFVGYHEQRHFNRFKKCCSGSAKPPLEDPAADERGSARVRIERADTPGAGSLFHLPPFSVSAFIRVPQRLNFSAQT